MFTPVNGDAKQKRLDVLRKKVVEELELLRARPEMLKSFIRFAKLSIHRLIRGLETRLRQRHLAANCAAAGLLGVLACAREQLQTLLVPFVLPRRLLDLIPYTGQIRG